MSTLGPDTWTAPLFDGLNGVPSMVISGQAVELDLESYSASLVDPQGIYVETAAGQHLPHQLLESAAAPLSMGAFEGEVQLQQVSEEIRRLIHQAAATARGAALELWLDRPGFDFWEGDGSRTTFTLSRSTGFGSTGVSWADRPARCWVATTAQTMVTGAPSAGECQLSQSADATQIVLGTAPGSGVVLTLEYYPVLKASVSISEDKTDFNTGTIGLEFEERIPVREYST